MKSAYYSECVKSFMDRICLIHSVLIDKCLQSFAYRWIVLSLMDDISFYSVAAVIVVAIAGVLLKRKRVVGKLWRPDGYKKPRRELTIEDEHKMKVSIFC